MLSLDLASWRSLTVQEQDDLKLYHKYSRDLAPADQAASAEEQF